MAILLSLVAASGRAEFESLRDSRDHWSRLYMWGFKSGEPPPHLASHAVIDTIAHHDVSRRVAYFGFAC